MRSVRLWRCVWIAAVLGCVVVLTVNAPAAGTPPVVTPVYGGMVGGSIVAVDVTAGDQLDPHVSADIAAYTDAADPAYPTIRYHDFLSPVAPNAAIPRTVDEIDTLSDVDGIHIAVSRYNQVNGVRAAMVYDVVAHTIVQIGSAAQVGATALGGDTIAFVNGSPGEIMVGSLSNPSGPLTNVSLAPANNDIAPAVSPGGNAVVWASCVVFNCNVMKSVRAGAWSSPAVVASAASNPDTDGSAIVFDSAGDIFYQDLGGGPSIQLQLPGVERNPSISGGIIAFESAPAAGQTSDLFVYQPWTNTVFRVTDTPLIDETLNDITVLPNGNVRVVWAADDDASQAFARNIYARTFSLPSGQPGYHFAGFFSPVDNLPALNLAVAGSAIPVKFSLGGDQGLAIFAQGYPASGPIACDASEPGNDIEETATAGNSNLSYNALADQYTYVWKTDKGWKGTCRLLVIGFSDGSQAVAKFRFK